MCPRANQDTKTMRSTDGYLGKYTVFFIPWILYDGALGCQTSNGAQGHLGKLISSFTFQVTWPQLGETDFGLEGGIDEGIPGWMPLPHGYHHCWRVEAGGLLYSSRPLKETNLFFFSERPEKLKAPVIYWGGKGGFNVRWMLCVVFTDSTLACDP